jgi:ubiquinone/menaquinone biosynthesis C-methylase UbiE
MDRSQSIQQQFGAAAARYAASRYHQTSADLEAMLAAAASKPNLRVLDVGTGTGHTALAFAERALEVVGIDLTPAMLEQARSLAAERGAANVRFELGDAMALPFEDSCFDLVTCRVCAHHFADPQTALGEAARVLRPGGELLLVDSVSPEDPASDTYLNCIELIRDPSHVRNYSVLQWQAMLRDAGLGAEWLATYSIALDFDDWVERMGTPQRERAELRALFERAPDQVRASLGIRSAEPYGFQIPIALFRGRLAV